MSLSCHGTSPFEIPTPTPLAEPAVTNEEPVNPENTMAEGSGQPNTMAEGSNQPSTMTEISGQPSTKRPLEDSSEDGSDEDSNKRQKTQESPLDYVIDKESLEMPSIPESDGGD